MNGSRSLAAVVLVLLAFVSSSRAQVPRVNLAKYQATQASSATGADPALFATDGIVGNATRWRTETAVAGPHWLIVTLPLPMELGSAQLFLGRDDIEPVATFSLQWWNGSTWLNIPGATFTGNTSNVFNIVFASPVTTSRVRFYSTDPVVRVRELALYAPNGPGGYSLGTDVTLNMARKRKVTASSVDASNYGKGAVDGYVDDASRWKSATVDGPHTLEIDLFDSARLGSAHVYFGTTAAAITNFTLEWWNGSAWALIPGGSVTNNTNYTLRVLFASPVVAARVRLNIPAAGSQRVRELLFFAANGTDGYPLGTDVVTGPAPSTKIDTYGDGFWKNVNVANPHSLLVSGTGASQTIPTSTEDEKLFQIFYNLDNDTFRLRNRDSSLCIGARAAGKTNGTPVVEMADYQGMPHELWRFQSVGGNNYRILNVWSGLALESDANTPATVTLAPPSGSTRQQWHFDYGTHFPKKGTAGWEGDWARFGANWSYNWGRDTGASLPADVIFSPMQYGRWWPDFNTLPNNYPAWHTTSRELTILGYNEPEEESQGNTPLGEGLDLWPRLERTDVPLVSPAGVQAFGQWMTDFYDQVNAQGLRVDFTAVHWYGNPSADGLINHLQSVYNSYGRPVWLTEFSTVDWSSTRSWTEEDNYRFMSEFLWRAEDLLWLKRYSIFVFTGDPSTNPWDRNGQRSDMISNDGALTAFGELYAAWDGDRTLRNRTPYILHNRGSMHRLRASSTTSAPSNGNIRRSDVSAQWALVPNTAGSRSYIVSLRDGRRLRYNGTTLDLALPGTIGAAVEWTFNDDANGYYFVDHPATSKSLRLNRTNDGNGAPTALDYGMEVFGTVGDPTRWRFIKPFQPVSVATSAPPAILTATGGVGRVTLGWAAPGTNILRYSVYRAPGAGGTYVRIGANITTPNFADTTVVTNSTYRYVVTATDWLESESAYSASAVAAALTPGTYAYWSATAFASNPSASRSFGDDPDGDGWKNGLEYASLTDPLAVKETPFLATRDDAGGLLITYSRNRSATDLGFELVADTDLEGGDGQVIATEIVAQTTNGPVDRVTVRPLDGTSLLQFYRLRVWLINVP